ncbi:hypothetical protein WDW37_17965 [Bdellovibrionota bacterium FG-1]
MHRSLFNDIMKLLDYNDLSVARMPYGLDFARFFSAFSFVGLGDRRCRSARVSRSSDGARCAHTSPGAAPASAPTSPSRAAHGTSPE